MPITALRKYDAALTGPVQGPIRADGAIMYAERLYFGSFDAFKRLSEKDVRIELHFIPTV